MKARELPDIALLRQCFRYEEDTGRLFWLPRPPEHFSNPEYYKSCNARYAGKEAGVVNHQNYRVIWVAGGTLRAHRIIWALHFGAYPDGDIDHINGDPSDNRVANLRDVPHAENMRNLKLQKNNTSGVSGVRWKPNRAKWEAKIKVAGKFIYLGEFKKFSEAVAARKEAEKTYGFHANHGKR